MYRSLSHSGFSRFTGVVLPSSYFPDLTPCHIQASTQSCPAMLSASPELLTSSALYMECLHCSSLNKPIQLSAELSSRKGLVSWVQSQCLATWVASHGNTTQHTTLDRLFLRRNNSGTSLVVQWLELCTSTAGGTGLIPGWGTKIPHSTWCSQKKKFTYRKIHPVKV